MFISNIAIVMQNVRHKSGISLITLIITIIVIIILAAIVFYNGLNTPDSAQFAKFTQDVDDLQLAVTAKHVDLRTNHAIAREKRTDEQIYLEIATGEDHGMEYYMCTSGDSYKESEAESTGIQNITVTGEKNGAKFLNMNLPNVRESNTAWYVTKDGRVFNANGYTYNGKTYFDARTYQEGELGANDTVNDDRAVAIYEDAIKNGTHVVTNAPGGNNVVDSTTYLVSFNTDGGSEVDSQNIVSGGTVTRPSNPIKDGYTFVNWYSDSSKTSVFDFSTIITGATTIYAKWTEIESGPTITEVTSSYTGIREVVISGEHFYVVGTSPIDSTKVRLLAKYNLNQAGTAQQNANYETTACKFSTSNYWHDSNTGNPKNVYGSSYSSPYPDLTVDSGSIDETDGKIVLYKAQEYGKKMGVIGTVLTYEQALALSDSSSNWSKIVFGRYEGNEKVGGSSGNGYLNWWTASAGDSSWIWDCVGEYSYFDGVSYSPSVYSKIDGVRPVIDVPASLIPN